MKKKCPVCLTEILDDQIIIVLLLGKFKDKEKSYEVEAMNQTIVSHLYCVDAREKKESTNG